jgi:hypothetical protein
MSQKTNRWWTLSCRIITRILNEGRRYRLSDQKIIERIDLSYPFGERAYWPYKEWLAARKAILSAAGIRTAKQRKADAIKQAEMEKEIASNPLFGGGA